MAEQEKENVLGGGEREKEGERANWPLREKRGEKQATGS